MAKIKACKNVFMLSKRFPSTESVSGNSPVTVSVIKFIITLQLSKEF